ncbi:hypothetical protein KJ870_00005, partial [bacterium]|nr:hypothetical protein [bacterium]MBU1504356.1 hypothetical protein [bacterium]
MAAVIGKIASIDGVFYAKGADGSLRELSRNDEIYEGEIIVGDKSNSALKSVIVSMVSGEDIVLLGAETQLFDGSLAENEFTKEETVTNSESIEALLDDNTATENVDEFETAAGEEALGAESTEDVRANFAQINDEIIDINAEIKDIAAADNVQGDVFTDETRFAIVPDAEVIRLTSIVNELITTANDAATVAETAAQAATDAAQTALDNPTDANIQNAADAATAAQSAADAAASANEALATATTDLANAASAANEDVSATLATSSQAQETTATAMTNAADAASTTATTATELAAAEAASDAMIADLLAAANNAADAANAAIANAEQAADTLAANPNPTSADIQTAQNAINAAE